MSSKGDSQSVEYLPNVTFCASSEGAQIDHNLRVLVGSRLIVPYPQDCRQNSPTQRIGGDEEGTDGRAHGPVGQR